MLKLLIVIPAYNEAECIERVVDDLIRHYPQYDYVVVNDGSQDKTAAICRRKGYHLIDLPANLGLAGAFQTGLRYAAEHGYTSFTSTLFVSPYQNHELLRQTAEELGRQYGVPFLYRDFRPGFRDGQRQARELGFYMQKYCGCIFSEEERYIKAKKILP